MAITGRNIITLEMIYSKLDALQIFQHYCTNFKKCDSKFASDLRSDHNASCSIAWINGDYLYHDFGTGDSFRSVNYVMQKFNLTYYDALLKIQQDFNLIVDISFVLNKPYVVSTKNTNKSIEVISSRKPVIIKIKSRLFNKADKSYWYDRYSVHSQTLKQFAIIPITDFWIDKLGYSSSKYAYSYDFYWEAGVFRRKLYQPFKSADKGKWISNGGLVVQGEGCLPYTGDLLIITKSLKDVIVLYELGYVAIAPTSESSWLPESYFKKQAARFKRQIIFFDNDVTGRNKAQVFSNKYNLKSIMVPEDIKDCKDISDVIYSKGIDFTKKLIKELL